MFVSSKLSRRSSIFASLYTVLLFFALLISIVSYLPSEAIAQIGQQYLICKYYCEQYNISIEYPADYVKYGNGTAWFVEFSPTPSSAAAVTIFVDFTPSSSSLDGYFTTYYNGISSNHHVESTSDTSLDNQPAKAITYTYLGPDGASKKAEDIIVTGNNNGATGVYTLSFLGNSDDFDNAFSMIQHVASSFHFLS